MEHFQHFEQPKQVTIKKVILDQSFSAHANIVIKARPVSCFVQHNIFIHAPTFLDRGNVIFYAKTHEKITG